MLTNVSFETAVQYNNTLDYGSQGCLKPASRHSLFVIFSEGGGRGQEERSGEGVGGLDSKKWPWLQIESEMLLGLRFDSSWELRIFFGPRS